MQGEPVTAALVTRFKVRALESFRRILVTMSLVGVTTTCARMSLSSMAAKPSVFPANRDYRPAIQPTTALLDDTETLV